MTEGTTTVLDELLDDPMVKLVMARDSVRPEELRGMLLKVAGWQRGAPYHEGTANFQVMREWNRSEVYRKTIALFTDRLGAR